ncbi:MAG: Flotillin [Acidobacteriaceae bacterium]|nr:Flotillin [Acidobacteriaceae bacterium]
MYFGLSTEVWIVIGSGLLVLAFLMSLLARLYRKAGPHEALIVYGFRAKRVVVGRGTIVFPMMENCHELSLELMSFDVAPQQDLYTKQGVAVTVEAVAQIKVKSDTESIWTASEQFLTKSDQEREGLIKLVMEGHLRGIIGQLTVEEIVKQPEMVGDRMRSTCADDMNKMGLEVISFTIKEFATRMSTSSTWASQMWLASSAMPMWRRLRLIATPPSGELWPREKLL